MATNVKPRQPSSNTTVHDTTFTVPANEYCLISIPYDVNTAVSSVSIGGAPGATSASQTSGHQSGMHKFWLKTGQTVTLSKSTGSGNDNSGGGNVSSFTASRVSSVTVTIDGANSFTISSHSHWHWQGNNPQTISVSFVGESSSKIIAEHYSI